MIVVYADEVYEELYGIWRYNAERRTANQATDDEAFLIRGIDSLADMHPFGRPVDGFPRLRSMAFRRNPRGDGHLADDEVDPAAETVTVLHVFHTKQNVRGRLVNEEG